MESSPSDVIVAGGGPAGASLAVRLSSRGIRVQVLEEHASFGSPSHCAGVVGTRLLDDPIVGRLARQHVLNKLSGAVFISPSGRRLVLEAKRPAAVALDRPSFDKSLAEAAGSQGAILKPRSRVVGTQGGRIEARIQGERQVLRADVVVGATGSRFTISRIMGQRKEGVVPGIQARLSGVSVDPNMVIVYLGKSISDEFFGYVVPLGSREAVAGVCSSTLAYSRLQHLLKLLRGYAGEFKIVGFEAGSVVYGYRSKTAWRDKILLGDEALQTKPLTGGGVYYLTVSSRIACECISRYLDGEATLESYDALWKREIGREIRFGLRMKRFLAGLSDETLDALFEVGRDLMPSLREADFDRHSSVAPIILRFFPRLVSAIGFSESMQLGRLLVSPD